MALPLWLGTLRARLIQAWRDRAVFLKALSFATVGAINTVVDASIFFLLLAYVAPSLFVANVTAWLIAAAAQALAARVASKAGECLTLTGTVHIAADAEADLLLASPEEGQSHDR